MTTQTHAPLHQLAIDEKSNVRKHGRGVAEPPFVGSIREKGIIEPLIVRKNGNGFLVTNGGKRCAALAYLGEHGEMAAGVPVTPDYQVPIIIREEDDTQARDTSLITNIVRTDMHPVDQYEAFAAQVKDGRKPADLAAMYGIDEKRIEQALALGQKLVVGAREAWRNGEINAEIAQALTLAPDQKAQEKVLAKALKDENYDADDIAREFKINGGVGVMLEFVGIAEYEARGGKVGRDLFGSNHKLSDEKLVKAMCGEKLDAMCEQLVKDGWAWAKVLQPNEYPHDYGHIYGKESATDDDLRKLNALGQRANNCNFSNAEQDAAGAEHDKLEAEITSRSFAPEMRAKSGVFLKFETYRGLQVDYGRTKPEERKKVEAQVRANEHTKKVKAAKKDGSPGIISNALHQRLSEQLTAAVSKTILCDPKVALPAILAGFSAGATVCVEEKGLVTKRDHDRKMAKFETAFTGYRKLALTAQLAALAEVVAAAIDMQECNVEHKPLKDEANLALIGAMNQKAFNDAIHSAFDVKDYFDSASKGLCLAAITEAINADEARKVAGKPKTDIAKFAIANVPKTKWLPVELRTIHYDGPAAKVAAKTQAKRPRAKGRANAGERA